MLKIKQLIPENVCLKCLGCCRFGESENIWVPQLLKEEKKYFPGGNKRLFTLPHPSQGNFICSFLSACDNKCQVYSFRPFECRLYPFLLNLCERTIFLAVDLNCPFVKENAGKEKLKKYSQYLIRFFRSPKGREILRDNLHLAQGYPKVLNIQELKI